MRPLFVRLPQIIGYFKKFNENVTIFFRVNNKIDNRFWKQTCLAVWLQIFIIKEYLKKKYHVSVYQ